jgi:hypothetical protein
MFKEFGSIDNATGKYLSNITHVEAIDPVTRKGK